MNENVDPATMREVRPAPLPSRRHSVAARRAGGGADCGSASALVLAVVAILGWERWEQHRARHDRRISKPAEKSGPPPQTIRAAAAERGDMPITIDALGTVTPLATVTVHTQIAGRLMSVGFQEGQLVKAGDFLDQIDPRPYEAALAQAQAQLAKDTALMQQAQADLARYQTLNRQDSIAKQQVDDQQFLVAQDKAAMASPTRRRSTPPSSTSATPASSRRSTAGSACGSSTPAITCSRPTPTASSSSPQLDPISVVFTTPEDNLPRITARLNAGAKLPVDRVRPRQRQAARGRRADDLRQSDRHHDRHVQAARQLRQPRQRAVPEPVRQRAAARRHADQRRARAQRRGAARPERAVRLCREGRRDGRGAQGEDRRRPTPRTP